MNYEGATADKLKIQNDNQSDAEFRQFLASAYTVAHHYLNDGASFYIWHADSEGYNFRAAAKDANLQTEVCRAHPEQKIRRHYLHLAPVYTWKIAGTVVDSLAIYG